MKKILLLFLLLQKPSDTPKMPEIHQLKLQALYAKKTSIQDRAARLQLEYEKQSHDLETQYTSVSKDLDAELKAAYAETKVSQEEWAINGDTGLFVPKPKDQDKK